MIFPCFLSHQSAFATDDADEGFQIACLRNILLMRDARDVLEPFFQDIRPDAGDLNNVCAWKGLKCNSKGYVVSLHWESTADRHVDIDWLPPSLEHIKIRFFASLDQVLKTRKLPPGIITNDFSSCHLRGTPDLRTLPTPLEILDLSHNLLSGTLHFTKLPTHIERIKMHSNQIAAVIVHNESLPKSLIHAGFAANSVKVKFVCLDGKAVDSRINKQLPKTDFRPMVSYLSSDDEVSDD